MRRRRMRPTRAGLLLATALSVLSLVAAGCGAAPRASGSARRAVVPAGVRVDGLDVGGLEGADVEAAVAGLAAKLARPPRNAYVDPSTHGLVPGVDGVELNVPATVAALLSARPRSEVAPVLRELPPSITLAQLPAAPIYNGPPERRAVAFVINVAWGDQYIPAMLRTLTADQAAATWCFVGRWAETHPELVREIVAAGRADPGGFTYCNHGYRDHGWALLGEPQALASIAAADGVITDLTGQTPRYFSPHRGEWNPAVLAASRASGHELVLWSLDTIDWKNPTASSLRVRIGHRVKAGDIVLMHPTAPTAEALAGMIQAARAKGLTLTTLDRLLSPRRGPWDGGVG